MNGMRRSLIGLGVAGLPLAVVGRGLLARAQEPEAAPASDPLLAYLLEDTKRNCRLAMQAGRPRSKGLRGLGANVEVLAAYLLARHPAPVMAAAVDARVRQEGVDGLAQAVRDAWPARAEEIARLYGAHAPRDLDYAWVTAAIEYARKPGFPSVRFLRRGFEREADLVEQFESQAGAVAPVRQTPGNDYGPPGWSAGLGDPSGISCYDLGIFIALIGCLAVIFPEAAGVFGGIAAGAGLYYAIMCAPANE